MLVLAGSPGRCLSVSSRRLGARRRTRRDDEKHIRGYRHASGASVDSIGTANHRELFCFRPRAPVGGEPAGGYRPCRSERMKLWSNRNDRSAASCVQCKGSLTLKRRCGFTGGGVSYPAVASGPNPTSCKIDVARLLDWRPAHCSRTRPRKKVLYGRVRSLLCLWAQTSTFIYPLLICRLFHLSWKSRKENRPLLSTKKRRRNHANDSTFSFRDTVVIPIQLLNCT